MKLTTPFETFKTSIEQSAKGGEALLEQGISDEEQFAEAKKFYDGWRAQCLEYLEETIENDTSDFISDFAGIGGNEFVIPSLPSAFRYRLKNRDYIISSY